MRRGRELIKTLYLLPAVISTVAIAFLFVRIYSIDPVGLLNQLLHWIGLGSLGAAVALGHQHRAGRGVRP